PFSPGLTAGKTPIRIVRGESLLKSTQMPPLLAPFSVIWIGSQNLVLSSLSGSVLIHTENAPPQPPFLNARLSLSGRKIRPLFARPPTASSAPPLTPLPRAILKTLSSKPLVKTYVPGSLGLPVRVLNILPPAATSAATASSNDAWSVIAFLIAARSAFSPA